MNIDTKRSLLFFVGCIGSRVALTNIARTTPSALSYLAMFATAIATGFSIIYIFQLRQTGVEVFGNRIWWNNLRPVHAILWGLFAYFASQQSQNAWKLLGIDTMIGIISFFTLRPTS